MSSRRKARKLLKAYGKELYNSRIEFMDSFTDKPTSFEEHIDIKLIFKRCVTAAAALTLVFSMCAVTANALGISLFNMDRTIHSDSDEYRIEEKAAANLQAKDDNGNLFYKPSYIPKGYEARDVVEMSSVSKMYIYSDGEHFLTVDVSIAEASTISVDNERSTKTEDVIDGKQVIIYDFVDEEDGAIYLMQEGDMLITIKGVLSEEEFEKIIYGLK